MASDFTGANDTYPVLLMHEHYVASQREDEKARNNPVVCLALDGTRVDVPPARESAAASAPCMGPAADAATGRVFAQRSAFDDAHAVALAVSMDSCYGGLVFLGGETRTFVVREQAHDFTVSLLDNNTFTVDGQWIRPGSALKVGYYLHYGSAYDQSFVRIVFDNPGQWRLGRMAPYFAEIDGGNPPRPNVGTGLMVDVPLMPTSLRVPLDAVINATPGRVTGIDALRLVHDGTRLTEATIRLATERGTVTWYGAGRTGDSLRLLGAQDASLGRPFVDPAAFSRAFDMPWTALRADAPGTGLTDVRLQSNVSWSSPGGRVISTPPAPGQTTPCGDPCVLVHVTEPTGASSWQRLVLPQEGGAAAALTLKVIAWGSDTATVRWWHAPMP